MKKLIILFILFSRITLGQSFTIDQDIYDNKSIPFISHSNHARFGSYLSMNIKYTPVKEVYRQLLQRTHLNLKNRGEAHITVITPVEFDRVLSHKLTIGEINQIALDYNIQESGFDIVCIGRGEAVVKGKIEKSYFIVIRSEDLIQIRMRVRDLFLERGGNPSLFNVENYFPHITLGFTKRDLHESDGVIKDHSSCLFDIN